MGGSPVLSHYWDNNIYFWIGEEWFGMRWKLVRIIMTLYVMWYSHLGATRSAKYHTCFYSSQRQISSVSARSVR
jgi:hypothetical protein